MIQFGMTIKHLTEKSACASKAFNTLEFDRDIGVTHLKPYNKIVSSNVNENNSKEF